MEDLQFNLEDRTKEEQSEILAKDIIKCCSSSDGFNLYEERIHRELDIYQIRGSLSITTELANGKISKHIEFIGYDYKVQIWLKFAYFI